LMDALLTKNLLVFNLVHGLYYPTTIELTNWYIEKDLYRHTQLKQPSVMFKSFP
jgi:hypothetical protein